MDPTRERRLKAGSFMRTAKEYDSRWMWPDVPCPPDSFWATWRRWIRADVQLRASSPSKRAFRPMQPTRRRRLGGWHRAETHIRREWSYDESSHLTCQNKDGTIKVCENSNSRKFFARPNQVHVGWKNMLRGRTPPLWGETQNDFCCQICANDNDKRPNDTCPPQSSRHD